MQIAMSSLKMGNLLRWHMQRRLLSAAEPPRQAARKEGHESYGSVDYWREGRTAHVMLNRPDRLNAIDAQLPFQLQSAIQRANWDDEVTFSSPTDGGSVHAVLLYGAGKAFCAGYDLKTFAEERDDGIDSNTTEEEMPRYTNQEMPWDPSLDYQFMWSATQAYMEIWRSNKPVVAKIKRVAIGGGSDIALACDVTFIETTAKIGYPPSTIWGCPTSAFWYYRLGMEKAKRILFTGEILSGEKAARIGLIGEAVPPDQIDQTVDEFMERLGTVPKNQLWYHKTVTNQAVEAAGLLSAQRLSTIFDGMSRHSPEGVMFQKRCVDVGFKKTVKERDCGKETVWSHLPRQTTGGGTKKQ
ncbi:probable enoyl-CoA hydratase isoform X2 [Folsomia candida]|uniref:3-hydroxypropionyl-coenzyme A dehydratase n=1 Tax=Folsomia candida TaxID=158441 RepID=A0A226E4J0_FOLCA|nr:probable enoyl-CoA hydratase isoform X2 [Folsomia candida]OXA51406.1 3-hydroxypropionyl-coenzyme A dehydratase [Folsomia candida]